MRYVIGVDLGTSAVKILIVNKVGTVVHQVSKEYSLIHSQPGYSEQNPEDWVEQTISGLQEIFKNKIIDPTKVDGISFSGQMHGLVLLDKNNNVLRNAILWNDTRTTPQCKYIYEKVGKNKLLNITKNLALEGFTLPKLLWVKEHEPHIYERAKKFLLPKDYLRYRLTDTIAMDYSDAAGTLLLNVENKEWSQEICDILDIDMSICPLLVDSVDHVGNLSKEIAETVGLDPSVRVFAGGADNACGAIGAGIIEEGKTLCSIGTSGVVLTYEEDAAKDFEGKVHYFNHSVPDSFYTMGVTLSSGYSLSWFKNTFAKGTSFDELLGDIETVPVGSNGLLFTPYLVGERTPHADANIRSSFIGIDSTHKQKHFVRSVLEGITFSLNETIRIFREKDKKIDSIVSIGGGAKSEQWLQMQADIFNANIVQLKNEQGPGMGAAIVAATGAGWCSSLKEAVQYLLREEKVYQPIHENVKRYNELFSVYQDIYHQTASLSKQLSQFRT